VSDTRLRVELRHPAARMPAKAHASDACFDLVSPVECMVAPGAVAVVDLGLAIQLEEGWEAQIRGRSGLASRGYVVHPGTVDHLYRQNLKVVLYNLSSEPWVVYPGDRIAQMKISRVWSVFVEQAPIDPTSRGGLGSTGR
jgi:dUTP pyrophosphatase